MKTKKMKRAMMSLGMAALMSACSSDALTEEQGGMELNFNVLQVEQIPMSRAALKDACTTLNYYRYTNGALAKSTTQTSSETNFGSFSDYLTWGTHELCFVGHNSTANEQSGVVSFDKVTDTFSHYVQLEVDENTSKQQSFSLTRRVAKFELLIQDAIPDYLGSVKFEITGGATALNLRAQKGAAVMKQTKSMQIPSGWVGYTDNTLSAFMFLPDGVDEVSIIVTTYDKQGDELVEYDFGEVDVQANYITRFKGNMFGINPTFTITVDNEWEDVWENEF